MPNNRLRTDPALRTSANARPNKRVQSDAAAAAGIGAKIGYVTRVELKRASEKSRRG